MQKIMEIVLLIMGCLFFIAFFVVIYYMSWDVTEGSCKRTREYLERRWKEKENRSD